MSLEESLEFINDDELVEVTPKTIRIRKKILDNDLRAKEDAKRKSRTLKTDIAKAVVSIMKPQLLFMLKLNAVRKIIRKSKNAVNISTTNFLERITRLELATSTLARWRSTR